MSSAKFALFNLKRISTRWSTLISSIVLPVVFYLIFSSATQQTDAEFGNGNVAAYVMVGMALYGGITGAVSTASNAVVENITGWGRTLALTPLRSSQIMGARLLLIAVHAVLPVAAVFLTGALFNAEMQPNAWWQTFLLTSLLSLPFGFYGLVWAQALKTPASVSIATMSVVVLGFAANMFVPLSGAMLQAARFTPLYGAAVLTRYPLTEGTQVTNDGDQLVTDPLWWAIVSVIVWSIIFAGASMMLDRREKGRE
ncbi:ABC transporter permease [Corynebacterium sp. 20_84]